MQKMPAPLRFIAPMECQPVTTAIWTPTLRALHDTALRREFEASAERVLTKLLVVNFLPVRVSMTARPAKK